jgi:hypothetical protein
LNVLEKRQKRWLAGWVLKCAFQWERGLFSTLSGTSH